MRRDPALAGLSCDHHEALLVALRLKRATAGTLNEAIGRLRDYWDGHARDHLAAEEQILLPVLAGGGRHEHPVVAQVLLDHLVLRSRAELLLASAAGADRLHEAHGLGTALAEHVRREERVLFPLIEEALSRDELDRVAQRLEHARLRSTRRSGSSRPPESTERWLPLSFGPLPGPGDSEGG